MCEKCFDDPAAIESARILTQAPGCATCGSLYTREDFTRLLDERDALTKRVEELEKLVLLVAGTPGARRAVYDEAERIATRRAGRAS